MDDPTNVVLEEGRTLIQTGGLSVGINSKVEPLHQTKRVLGYQFGACDLNLAGLALKAFDSTHAFRLSPEGEQYVRRKQGSHSSLV
jgi:hypothetical protein